MGFSKSPSLKPTARNIARLGERATPAVMSCERLLSFITLASFGAKSDVRIHGLSSERDVADGEARRQSKATRAATQRPAEITIAPTPITKGAKAWAARAGAPSSPVRSP